MKPRCFLEEMACNERVGPADQGRLCLLGLQTYFTVGPKEARPGRFPEGNPGPASGEGVIHGFREGFHPLRDDCL